MEARDGDRRPRLDGEREFLTVEEAASRLDVSVRTLQRWCAMGAIPTLGLGRVIRIPRHAFEQILRNGRDYHRAAEGAGGGSGERSAG